ncbi:MAG TPA: alpha/beta hydrolase [Candidatus Binataceae bacterium]|nr:alpha/beta hydrolase [Candidatus Binataceae bacterium]
MRERRFNVNGLKLNCLDYGGEGKPPLLFVHGGSAHAHWWDFVAPAFTDRFHALALDQRGHGESEWPQEWGYGSRHYASDLAEVIGQLGNGAPVIVGHSMGAHNTLVYAAEHSGRTRAIVVIDSRPDYSERAVEFLRGMSERPARRFATLKEAVENFRLLPRETLAKREVLDHVARHSFKQLPDGSWIHKLDRRTMVREPLDMWAELRGVICPALVVKITRSFSVDIDTARQIAAALPKGRLAEIGDSNHHVMLDNPDGLIATLNEFFAGLE